jgi:hypothetical protein
MSAVAGCSPRGSRSGPEIRCRGHRDDLGARLPRCRWETAFVRRKLGDEMGLTFREHVSVAETEYGVVLLDTRTGNYWQLNPTAAVAAKVLAGGGDVASAARRLVEEFDVDDDCAAADVAALVESLRAAGVVT